KDRLSRGDRSYGRDGRRGRAALHELHSRAGRRARSALGLLLRAERRRDPDDRLRRIELRARVDERLRVARGRATRRLTTGQAKATSAWRQRAFERLANGTRSLRSLTRMDGRIDRGDSLPGGYRVVDILRGGMGVVFICDQEATEQLWALKTFRPDGTPEETARLEQKFGDEVRNWVRISRERPRDHVVQALTFDAAHRLLILEFVDGLPLHRLGPPDCPIHPRHVIGWARDIAAGMRL